MEMLKSVNNELVNKTQNLNSKRVQENQIISELINNYSLLIEQLKRDLKKEMGRSVRNEEKCDQLETKLLKYTENFGLLKEKCREFGKSLYEIKNSLPLQIYPEK